VTVDIKVRGEGRVDPRVIMVGMICLTVLEIVALYNGINGTMFTMVVAAVAAAMGVLIPTPKWVRR